MLFRSRDSAQAMDASALVTVEPITIVLSEKGWVRAAKGHDVDPQSLNYKSGDAFQAAAFGRSNQLALFIDSSGRVYSLPAHTLPSARGQGEPLTGRLKPPEGAVFVGVMAGQAEDKYLVCSDAGYGFIASLGDIHTKNKSGKVLLSLPKGAKVLPPVLINDEETDLVASVSNKGSLLINSIQGLPELAKGKGIKLMSIPSKRVAEREEYVLAVTVLPKDGKLTIHSGQRHVTLKRKDIESYSGERGRRGNKLPRGFQRVDKIEPQD